MVVDRCCCCFYLLHVLHVKSLMWSRSRVSVRQTGADSTRLLEVTNHLQLQNTVQLCTKWRANGSCWDGPAIRLSVTRGSALVRPITPTDVWIVKSSPISLFGASSSSWLHLVKIKTNLWNVQEDLDEEVWRNVSVSDLLCATDSPKARLSRPGSESGGRVAFSVITARSAARCDAKSSEARMSHTSF